MIKRILVALGGSTSSLAAIDHAVELGRAMGAEVWGVTDLDVDRIGQVGAIPLGAGAAAVELIEHRRKAVERAINRAITAFEARCDGIGARCSVHRETGEPFERLALLWRYCDLTVAGLRGIFEYGVLHDPEDALLRLISRGVRPILAAGEAHRPIHRVLIAYNGSLESAKAMKRFVQMRMWPSAEMTIACFGDVDGAAELLGDAAAYCGLHGLAPATEHVAGPARRMLAGYARSNGFDLVVMGSTSRARLMKKLLGDTVLAMIRESGLPLFLAQ
jgi:nucleotide-binding universal stress UspA family protein